MLHQTRIALSFVVVVLATVGAAGACGGSTDEAEPGACECPDVEPTSAAACSCAVSDCSYLRCPLGEKFEYACDGSHWKATDHAWDYACPMPDAGAGGATGGGGTTGTGGAGSTGGEAGSTGGTSSCECPAVEPTSESPCTCPVKWCGYLHCPEGVNHEASCENGKWTISYAWDYYCPPIDAGTD